MPAESDIRHCIMKTFLGPPDVSIPVALDWWVRELRSMLATVEGARPKPVAVPQRTTFQVEGEDVPRWGEP